MDNDGGLFTRLHYKPTLRTPKTRTSTGFLFKKKNVVTPVGIETCLIKKIDILYILEIVEIILNTKLIQA